jgi:hypothetical protein
MTTNLMFAVVGLVGVIGLFNLLLTFGVIGRVRVLQEAVQTGVMRDPGLPSPGDAVGSFEVTTQDGHQLSEAAVQGDPALVCFFMPGCQPCADIRAQLLERPPALPLIAFVEGATDDPEVQKIMQSLRPLGAVANTQAGDAVTRAFKPSGFPTLIRTRKGNVAAAGHRLNQVL